MFDHNAGEGIPRIQSHRKCTKGCYSSCFREMDPAKKSVSTAGVICDISIYLAYIYLFNSIHSICIAALTWGASSEQPKGWGGTQPWKKVQIERMEQGGKQSSAIKTLSDIVGNYIV